MLCCRVVWGQLRVDVSLVYGLEESFSRVQVTIRPAWFPLQETPRAWDTGMEHVPALEGTAMFPARRVVPFYADPCWCTWRSVMGRRGEGADVADCEGEPGFGVDVAFGGGVGAWVGERGRVGHRRWKGMERGEKESRE